MKDTKKPQCSVYNLMIAAVLLSLSFICFLLFLALTGCSTSPSTEDVIKSDKQVEDPQVSCLQEGIIQSSIFKPDFKYDNSYPPTVTVYVTGEWNSLDDEAREERLKDVGRKWHECNPDNTSQVTVFAYDINDIPTLAVFVMKGE